MDNHFLDIAQSLFEYQSSRSALIAETAQKLGTPANHILAEYILAIESIIEQMQERLEAIEVHTGYDRGAGLPTAFDQKRQACSENNTFGYEED